mmetsp:Transcript_67962/g.167875  ORF Transcript_67962/g.167875 Transcript_67962/m.167875 type:complete len:181 (-) Transcript_67962:523-1065(-)
MADMDERTRLKRAKQGLTEEQLMEIREVFDTFDSDGGGSIDVDELRKALRALGQQMTQQEAEALIQDMDESGEGEIDFMEFVDFIKPKILAQDMEKDVRHQFGLFADEPMRDEDGNPMKDKYGADIPGYITIRGLRAVSEQCNECCTDEELGEIIEYVTDGEDKIDQPTFLKVCKVMRLF